LGYKKKTAKIRNTEMEEMEFLRSLADNIRKAQIRNTKIGDELNILI
jgi:hypothetical protein